MCVCVCVCACVCMCILQVINLKSGQLTAIIKIYHPKTAEVRPPHPPLLLHPVYSNSYHSRYPNPLYAS